MRNTTYSCYSGIHATERRRLPWAGRPEQLNMRSPGLSVRGLRGQEKVLLAPCACKTRQTPLPCTYGAGVGPPAGTRRNTQCTQQNHHSALSVLSVSPNVYLGQARAGESRHLQMHLRGSWLMAPISCSKSSSDNNTALPPPSFPSTKINLSLITKLSITG